MIFYESDVKKSVSKGIVPKDVFKRINNAFVAIDTTNDLGLLTSKTEIIRAKNLLPVKEREVQSYFLHRERELFCYINCQKRGGLSSMGVISVRLNKDEDKRLKQLSEYFHADRSTLIKSRYLNFTKT